MTAESCPRPLPLGTLVDYLVEPLPEEAVDRVETHLFTCESCGRALEALAALGDGVAALVREGRFSASVPASLVARLAGAGAHLRTYALRPGGTVSCTVAPEDDYVVVRLRTAQARAARLALSMAPEGVGGGALGPAPPAAEVVGDPVTGEVVLLYAGDWVRALPRSRWALTLQAEGSPPEVFTLDHHPWAAA